MKKDLMITGGIIAAFLVLLPLTWAGDVAAVLPAIPEVPTWAKWSMALVFSPLAWVFVRKRIVAYLASQFIGLVKVLLEKGDEDDDALTMAIVHWVERKCQRLAVYGPGRFNALAEYVCARAPLLRGREAQVADLLRGIVEGVEKAAEDIEAKAKDAPTEPPPPAAA